MSFPKQFATIRHGQTPLNVHEGNSKDETFYGGAHDDFVPPHLRGLTIIGERQAVASGLVFDAAELALRQTVTSQMQRTGETEVAFMSVRPQGTAKLGKRAAFNEVSHGTLEQKGVSVSQATDLEGMVRTAMERALSRKVNDRAARAYAGWLAALGIGDGTSHLRAGLDFCSAADELDANVGLNGTLIFTHHGVARDGRALGTSLTVVEREEVTDKLDALTSAYEDLADITTELYANGDWSQELSESFFSPFAEQAAPLVRTLDALQVPAIGDVLDKRKKVGNGGLVVVGIDEDGRWHNERYITAQFDPYIPPTADNVTPRVEPYDPRQPSWI